MIRRFTARISTLDPLLRRLAKQNLGATSSISTSAVREASTRPAPKKPTGSVKVFDQKSKLLQKEWAAMQNDSDVYDYLKDEVCFIFFAFCSKAFVAFSK